MNNYFRQGFSEMPAPGGMQMSQGMYGHTAPSASMYPPPSLPTGMPLGPAPGGTPSLPPSSSLAGQTTQTLQSPQFTAGFLKTQIGKRVRVDFLIGTNTLTDRSGILVGVGTSYILLRSETLGSVTMCDLYSIKFVTFF
ncbi:hypothetical protein DFR58_1497 [Anaerobacterium chartisolvens]|uniref:Uncharacterized protein n=1 Tax=Anaerobacterium chartisolvens TaxID=1297424 RepID=A0A369AHI3_9FIRM|nr:hypothetical protein [Anaerobacterium chartisolvens]RCX07808.1 hypothetical protein DFR58_1497 [Anaerobacterium chartisolvens]